MKLKAEKLLNLTAESNETGFFSDALSFTVNSVFRKYDSKMLSDDDLMMVAGGVDTDKDLIESIKNSVLR